MAATEYSYGWNPEFVVNVNMDSPFMEEKGGFGPFSQLGVVDTNHLYLSQWSTTDPTILHASDQSAWNSIRLQQQQRMYQTGSGGVYDLSIQSAVPAAVAEDIDVDVSQRNHSQQQILLDAQLQEEQQQQQQLPANSSNNNNNNTTSAAEEGTRDSPAAGEIYPWMHQMILNHFMTQERICINDQMPALFSGCSAQQPCLYTSSSECVQDADSSGSSGARDNYTPAAAAAAARSSGVTACSSEVINWRNSDVVQASNNNLVACSSTGFHIGELYDDSSSVGHVEIPETKDQASALSLVMQRYSSNHPVALIERSPSVSWAMPATESDAMTVNHCSTLDPQLLNIVGFQDISSSGVSSTCQPPPYKRPRLNNTTSAAAAAVVHLGVEPAATTITCSNRPLISSSSCSSFSQHRSMVGGRGSDYPMTSLKVADALYRGDFNFPNRQQQISPCSGSSFPQRGLIQESSSREGGGMSLTYGLRTGPTTLVALADHDYSPTTSNRKHNATSIEPQSVAARHRRKKISERIRVLEKLIPGGSKMDTASMLDEAVDYVKFLQLQVSLLEKLGELPENNNASCTRSQQQLLLHTSPSSSSPTMHGHGRPTTSPLILSEILQQQLFKQKLCLVSLRQYPSASSPSGSFA